jgi:beta-lactamase superfamily II metal-dependent hydrolase
MGSRVEVLKNYGDFILFRESPDLAVAACSFDNNWKLPAETVQKLKGSGVVTLR